MNSENHIGAIVHESCPAAINYCTCPLLSERICGGREGDFRTCGAYQEYVLGDVTKNLPLVSRYSQNQNEK
ncbi:MAG: hypothetical protein Q8P15_02180 [Nanoarchaeota archaeon]|nr:hypothetical protein [Nanoarchaeota archaeon]